MLDQQGLNKGVCWLVHHMLWNVKMLENNIDMKFSARLTFQRGYLEVKKLINLNQIPICTYFYCLAELGSDLVHLDNLTIIPRALSHAAVLNLVKPTIMLRHG